jgi:V/A-type H+-transporting ATPase subunit I
MKKFQILGLKKQIDFITEEIMKNSQIELLKTEKYHSDFKDYQVENSYKPYFNQVDKIIESLNLDKEIKNINFDILNKLNFKELEHFIKPIQKKIDKLERITKKLNSEEKRLKNLIKHVYVMRNIDI